MNSGGDVLARGAKTAQFQGAFNSITDFEFDFINRSVEEITEKYGLSQAEYDQYSALRLENKHLPDLRPVSEQEELEVGFSISDHRKNYLSEATEVKAAEVAVKKYPDPEFEEFTPVLDRILVMRITDNPDEEILEDGSVRNKKTGIITAAKYRQHSNVGIVLAVGQYVVLGGLRFFMSEFVQPGDKITYGDYNSEVFLMKPDKVKEICDRLSVNYVEDPAGIRIVRVQDIRGVEKRKREVVTAAFTYTGTGSITPIDIRNPMNTGGSNV